MTLSNSRHHLTPIPNLFEVQFTSDTHSLVTILAALNKEYPSVQVKVINNNETGNLCFKTTTAESSNILANIDKLENKPVKFTQAQKKTRLVKHSYVIHKYPTTCPLEMIQLHNPNIEDVERLSYFDKQEQTKKPTNKVKITFTVKDQAPPMYNIAVGALGLFVTVPYIPRPIRCTKCQKFGHIRKVCSQKDNTCALCSSHHFTNDCPLRDTDGQADPSKMCCPNCQEQHPSYDVKCSAYQTHQAKLKLSITKEYENNKPHTGNEVTLPYSTIPTTEAPVDVRNTIAAHPQVPASPHVSYAEKAQRPLKDSMSNNNTSQPCTIDSPAHTESPGAVKTGNTNTQEHQEPESSENSPKSLSKARSRSQGAPATRQSNVSPKTKHTSSPRKTPPPAKHVIPTTTTDKLGDDGEVLFSNHRRVLEEFKEYAKWLSSQPEGMKIVLNFLIELRQTLRLQELQAKASR